MRTLYRKRRSYKPASKHLCRPIDGRQKRDWFNRVGYLRCCYFEMQELGREAHPHVAYGRWVHYNPSGFSKRQGNPKIWGHRWLWPRGTWRIKTRRDRFKFSLSNTLAASGFSEDNPVLKESPL